MQKRPVFETITEIVGWIQILFSFLFIGALASWLLYVNYPNRTGLIGGIIIMTGALIAGIAKAVRAYNGKGTIHLISRVSATPELDEEESEENEKENE